VNVSVNPLQASRVYVLAEGGGVASSDDFGNTWTTPALPDPVLHPPLPAGARITTVTAAHPTTPNQVWVGTSTGDVFVTFDAGQSWGEFGSASMPARPVSRITVNPRGLQPPEVWVTFEGLSTDSIWSTQTGGQFWSNRHNPNLPTTGVPVSSLAIYGA